MSVENLVIVESPAKAKTIEKILGKDYTVTSCYGHVRDLSKEKMGVDVKNDFAPKYVVSEDKKKVVSELKSLSKKAKTVWLATDEDREGEAISWHICELLDLDPQTTKRIVFHEITKPAITKAIQQPRTIDMDLVNAQQARRILDRIVGFKLSPILIQKVPSANSLSAGRVQSVAVRLIVDRETEISNFLADKFFATTGLFTTEDAKTKKNSQFSASAPQFKSEGEAEKFLSACKDADFSVGDVQVSMGSRNPAPPFTTSTLQQAAVQKLGYSVSRAMLVAQKLYEEGYITYMRTDSTNLSKTALDSIEQFVHKEYGKEYHQFRQYKTKSQSAQEAHEAIRPTDIERVKVKDSTHQALYDLIRKRTLASQMAEAKIEKTVVEIVNSKTPDICKAKGEVLVFDGFLKAYNINEDDEHSSDEGGTGEDQQKMPAMKKGQLVDLISMVSREKFSKSESRYNEATLVKKMEAMGIGRPSTYAPTIATILKRGYVEKKSTDSKTRLIKEVVLDKGKVTMRTVSEDYGAEKNRLFPTDLGMLVNEFLTAHFDQIMDYKFTAKIEEDFDEIAQGEKSWVNVLKDFFSDFDVQTKEVAKTAERVSGERELGIDPKTKKLVKARMGRYGPMVQLGEADEKTEEKAKFAKLLPTQQISTITLDEALDLLSLPKEVGIYKDLPMVIKQGPFGPYIGYDGKFYSLPKGENMFAIDRDRAIEIIEEKDEKDKNRLVKDFPEQKIQILNGRFGVYIKAPEGNFKIPKELKENPQSLTLQKVQEIVANPPAPSKGRWTKKNK